MAQKMGKTGNLNGRPKGVQNKVTREVKEMIESFLSNNRHEFEDNFKKITDPEKVCKIYLEAAKIIMPRPKDEGERDDEERRHMEMINRIWPVPKQD